MQATLEEGPVALWERQDGVAAVTEVETNVAAARWEAKPMVLEEPTATVVIQLEATWAIPVAETAVVEMLEREERARLRGTVEMKAGTRIEAEREALSTKVMPTGAVEMTTPESLQ